MARPVRRRVSVLVTAVVAGGLVAGCGEAAPASPFPPRPAEIDVTALDPCSLVGEDGRRSLGLSPPRPPGVPLSPPGSRGCAWSDVTRGYNLTVQTLPVGAGESVGAPGSRITQVAGFGAVEATSLGDTTPICQLVVDAQDAAAIRIQAQSVAYGDDGRPRGFTTVCSYATEFAEAVVRSASTRS